MKYINIDELRKLQLDILVAVDQYCKKHQLRYSLSSGTLIGAIRHNGYIPWDDDIDIMMPRKDYEFLVHNFNGSFKHLSLLAPELNWNYYAPYANVYDNRTILKEGSNSHRGLDIGVKIDIFPIDHVPVDEYSYVLIMKVINRLNSIMYIKRLNNIFNRDNQLGWIVKICVRKLLCSLFPYTFLQKIIRRIANNSMYEDSEYVDNVVFNIYSKKCTRFSKSVIESYIEVSFEGHNFSAIRDYDEVLRKMYGDYMQLPPEDKRVPHHNFEAYWID